MAFWIGLLTFALLGLKVWRNPTEDEARDLIDSSIEGRPLSVWTDRPSKADTPGWTLWQEHRDRMAALALRQGHEGIHAAFQLSCGLPVYPGKLACAPTSPAASARPCTFPCPATAPERGLR